MTKRIFILTGVPASGKTWVTDQLKHKYKVVANDDHIGSNYVAAIAYYASLSDKPILCEAPFSLNTMKDHLEAIGFEVTPVILTATEAELHERWSARNTQGGARVGHLSRQRTFIHRAMEKGYFYGTSAEVLAHLNQLP